MGFFRLGTTFIDQLRLGIVIVGLAFLIVSWRTIISGISKRQITFSGKKAITISIVLYVFAIALTVTPIIFILQDQAQMTRQMKIDQIVLHQPQHNNSIKKEPCVTSQATGASATKVFTIQTLINDGKTDDNQAIQNAIDTASKSGGGIVKIPSGTFLINKPLIMKDNVTLQGVGPTTIIKAGPQLLQTPETIGYSIITTNGASNVTIANLTADQQGNILDGNSINRFVGYVIDVYHSRNVIVQGVYTRNPLSYSIMAKDSTQFCIQQNNTQVDTNGKYDQLDGIHVLNSSFGDVINNYIDQGYGDDGDDGLVAHTINGSVHDITYAGNIVRGGKGGSGMQIALTNATDTIFNIKIQNNEFWGSPRGIRTGYYGDNGEKGGSVHDIMIGGSPTTGNYIHNNIFNNTNKGDTVNIYGNGIDPYNITVSYNKSCKAGTISVGEGINNIIHDNTDSLGC